MEERPAVDVRTDAPRPGGPSARTAHAVGALLLLVLLGSFAIVGGPGRDLVTTVATAAPTLALAWMLAGGRLPEARPWWFVLTGLAVLNLYNAVWMVQYRGPGAGALADVVLLLGLPVGYLVVLGGAVDLVYRPARRDGGAVVDATIIALSGSLAVWVLFLAPRLDPATAGADRALTMATLLLVSAIAGALLRAALLLPTRRTSMTYLLVTILATLAGTVGREMTTSAAEPYGAVWVSVLWLLAYTALVPAVLHPSAGTVAVATRQTGRLTLSRLVALGGALLVGPALFGVEEIRGTEADHGLLVAANLALVLLVVVRIAQLARWQADAEDALAHLAAHDELTGLPNRRALDTHVRHVLRRVEQGQADGALVAFLDLDDFKEVNDVHGHHVGDQLLVVVAERLRAALRPDDVVGRFGGDEFVLVVEGDPATLERDVLPRVSTALAGPARLPGHTLEARASIGTVVVRAGEPTPSAEVVLSTADARMYERKRARRTVETDPAGLTH